MKGIVHGGYVKLQAMDKPLPPFPEICMDDLVYHLEKCRKDKDRAKALWMHSYVHSCGMEGCSLPGNHLVSVLVEAGCVGNARQVFDKLADRTDRSWNALIIGYAKCGNPQHAIFVYERMREDLNAHPNEHTFVAVLKACSKIKCLQVGVKVHEDSDALGLLRANMFVGGALVDMYAKCGQISTARRVFDELPVQNVVSWTALISGYVDHGHAQLALLYLEQMHLEGVQPNIITLVCALRACGMIQALEKGRDLHHEIERQGLLEQELVGNTLVDMYAKCGALTLAKQVFDKLRVRDVVSWTALIIGYTHYGQGEVALGFFDQMQAEGVSPNAITFIASLKSCGSIKAAAKGRDIHAEIERHGLLETDYVLANALIDMYVKCGCLTAAHQVFEKLHVRDVVAWTSLIAGYHEYAHYEEALVFFEQMHCEGIPPNVVTLVCCSKACGSIEALDRGEIIHKEIERQGWLERDLVGQSLVDMYSKCGSMTMAQKVFDKLSIRDIDLWNALITGYAECGHGDTAVACIEEMQYEGLHPDCTTYASSLRVCGNIGAWVKGQGLHAEIERWGLLERDIVVGNGLLDMYAKCGLISLSEEVFERIPIRDVTSWTIIITSCVEYGYGEEALQRFEQMRLENVLPNAVTFVSVLKASSIARCVTKGKEIHVEILRQKLLEENLAVGNMLVDFYAKCGYFSVAQNILDELPERDVVSWTAIILGYAEHGYGEEALKCFDQMELEGISADPITLLCCLKACASIGAIERVQEIHAEIKTSGLLERNLAFVSTLVDIYTKCGSLDLAQQVFDSVQVRDAVLWTALIAGYAEHGHGEKALQCFEQMQLECVSPSASTFICSLKACGGIGDLQQGQEIHAELERQGFLEADVLVGSSLVDMYAKCGSLPMAQQVFDKLSVRNVVVWTALIAAYAGYGDGHDALACFDKMQLEGFLPNYVTFICCLKACANVGAAEKGQEIHLVMERQGMLGTDPVVGNALVDMYAKCGCLVKAQDVFSKLAIRTVVSWTTLMAGYAQRGESENVFHILDRMVEDSVKPNPVTFLIILSACNRMGLFDKSQMYLETMSKDYGLVPDAEHLIWVVDLLCRSGQFGEAVAMVKKMPSAPGRVVWHTLMDACRSSGNVKIGRQAFGHAITLDGGDAAAYVLLCHMYADSGLCCNQALGCAKNY